jgi:hypothetical protein
VENLIRSIQSLELYLPRSKLKKLKLGTIVAYSIYVVTSTKLALPNT